MEFKDYYQTLGVARTATEDEIRKSYRRLARKYHPDVSKEADAEARMKEVNEAYAVLSDPEKTRCLRQPRTKPAGRAGFSTAARLGHGFRVFRELRDRKSVV